ncbi:hypothetical protein Misp01_51010 [Microtetraspora sp. NBRC 13810]|nr:hypothetical protein Misp01_51010 [Microtetraspora sp. NBRC 13810]
MGAWPFHSQARRASGCPGGGRAYFWEAVPKRRVWEESGGLRHRRFGPPSHNPPSHNPPSHNPPSHNPPSHNPPSHNPPSHNPAKPPNRCVSRVARRGAYADLAAQPGIRRTIKNPPLSEGPFGEGPLSEEAVQLRAVQPRPLGQGPLAEETFS